MEVAGAFEPEDKELVLCSHSSRHIILGANLPKCQNLESTELCDAAMIETVSVSHVLNMAVDINGRLFL